MGGFSSEALDHPSHMSRTRSIGFNLILFFLIPFMSVYDNF